MLLRGILKRKAQSSVEFVMLITFTLMIASVLFYVLQNNLMEAERDRNEARVEQLMNIVNNEISLAQMSVPTYYRTFYLPSELYGSQYQINATRPSGGGTDIVINYKGQEYVFLIPTTLGNAHLLQKGENIILKQTVGEIILTTPTGEIPEPPEEPEPDPDPDPDPDLEVLYFTITTNPDLVTNANTNLYFNLSQAPQEFWENVKEDGGDIRIFRTDNGAQLAREISGFDRNQRRGSLFFNSAGLSATQETTYNITYGDPELEEPEADSLYGRNNVWDEHYLGVWHLDEQGSGSQNEYRDSTSYGHHGLGGDGNTNLVPSRTTGKLGYGQLFADNLNDNIRVPNHETLKLNGPHTISIWMKPNSAGDISDSAVFGNERTSCCGYIGGIRYTPTREIRYDTSNTDNPWTYGDQRIDLNTWHYITVTWTGTSKRIYINGNLDREELGSGSLGTDEIGVTFGWHAMSETDRRRFFGVLEEGRISGIARSQSWIQTEYNNQANNAVFWSLEEPDPDPDPDPDPEPEVTYFTITTEPSLVTNANTNLYYDLSLAPQEFWENVKEDGGDIRVTRNDGETQVAREVSGFDKSTSTGALFFDSTGLSTTNPTTWRIYFGDEDLNEPPASSTYGRYNVWDSNYAAVWHLAEQGSGSSGEYIDSTSNNNHGTGASIPTQVNGKLGFANYFNVDLINVPSSSSLELGTNDFTISAWINTDEADLTHNAIFGSGALSGSDPGYVFNVGNNEVIRFWVANGDTRMAGSSSSGLGFIDGEWHYVSVRVVRSAGRYYYHNGDYVSASTSSVFSGQNIASGNVKRIGRWSSSTSWAFKGIIDELRISRIARSEAWIQTEYNNQDNPGAFWVTGDVEGVPPGSGEPPETPPVITSTTIENTGGSWVNSFQFNHNNPSGSDMLIVFVGYFQDLDDGDASVSVSYGGQEMVKLEELWYPDVESLAFVLFNPPTGINEVDVTATDDRRLHVFARSVSGGSAIRESVIVSGVNEPISESVLSEDGDLIVDFVHWRNSGATVAGWGAGQSGVDDQGVNTQNSRSASSYKVGSDDSSSMSMSWSGNQNQWVWIGLSVS